MGIFPPSFLTPSSLFVQGNVFQDAVFNQTVTITEKEDGLDGETYVYLLSSLLFSLFAAAILILLLFFLLLRIFMYVFLSGLGLLVIIGLHQLLESRKVKTIWIKSETWVRIDVVPLGPLKVRGVSGCRDEAATLVLCVSGLICAAVVPAEEASGSQGGNGNLQPQRRGPQLDPSGNTQPDQYVCHHFLLSRASSVVWSACLAASVWLLSSLDPPRLAASLQLSSASVARLVQKFLHLWSETQESLKWSHFQGTVCVPKHFQPAEVSML